MATLPTGSLQKHEPSVAFYTGVLDSALTLLAGAAEFWRAIS